MTKTIVFTCDGPNCEKSGSPSDYGRFGHWITLSIPESETPYYNTQYGLAQVRYEAHFHHPRCLILWVKNRQGAAWTGQPNAFGKVDPEWQDAAAMREP